MTTNKMNELITATQRVGYNTLSGRIGKVVASHAAVARSIPPEVAPIYNMHEAPGGTAHEVGGATSQLDLPSLTPLFVVGCG